MDLIFRGQYIPKGALVIFDGLNKELCVGIHLVVIRIVCSPWSEIRVVVLRFLFKASSFILDDGLWW